MCSIQQTPATHMPRMCAWVCVRTGRSDVHHHTQRAQRQNPHCPVAAVGATAAGANRLAHRAALPWCCAQLTRAQGALAAGV
jgi:hypothetical protein